ncbi:pyridoxal phosphate-dependent aminotransferase family protein [Flagellimonas alvinocaridis]|uniref:Pyridoxal phosphate-dependent aminotransferase family protein n=1 Tax=Flagellimonas alvinocaridis TaxID=2530200 RepID=A0A4S8RPC5_9FLAO|nr:pyridoxal phosphate-dependent aminotransferase family protein [Allomuricauda alvinocaridis]THV59551.1 pyridoxal phosphate-dependent aminotransferase family protein [Allomuricauda alvinocaridis]
MALPLDRIPDRTIVVDDKEYLYFGGTSYLGLQSHPPFIELFLKNVQQYGLHYGASRKSNVRLEVYRKAEDFLGNWVGSEDCITLSSGYLAAQLVVQTLLQQGHSVIAASNAHTALLTDKIIMTNSVEDLQDQVSKSLEQRLGPAPVILFDTIDFSGGQFPNFETLQGLPLDKVILVGDDSHGIGLVGNEGNGCYARLKQLNPLQLIVCCSLGKGLGIQSGAIFGAKSTIEMFGNTAFFGAASPTSPAFMGTLMEARTIYNERRNIVMEHLKMFEDSYTFSTPFSHLAGHPTFEFCNPSLAQFLKDHGFIFTNFNYPDENGPIISRIVLSAYHSKEDVQKLITCLNSFKP